jgi:hypothetical protein
MDGAEARRILDEYFPRKKRFVGGNYSSKKYNIVGFGSENITEYLHCPPDAGVRLVKIKDELRCPSCGFTHKKEEAINEQEIQPQHAKQQTRIISSKNKKKYYADNDEEIKESDLYDKHVTYYHEEVPK